MACWAQWAARVFFHGMPDCAHISILNSLKQIIDIHSENVQTALPRSYPDVAQEPPTTEIIDLDYEILDVESQILNVAATLAVQTACITLSCDYLLCPSRLSSLTPVKLLSLLQAHLSRLQKLLAPDSALAPRNNETDQTLREGSGQQTRAAESAAAAAPPAAPRRFRVSPDSRL